MRIIYVGKHEPVDNQDEIAVTHALTKLGHTVLCLPEKRVNDRFDQCKDFQPHLLLINKLPSTQFLKKYRHSPKIFWYWDMIRSADYTVFDRGKLRVSWMREVIPFIDLGFCTDGDWVNEYPKNLMHLPQGCDERVAGYGQKIYDVKDVLFTGTINHGAKRQSHIKELKDRYGSRFWHVGHGGPVTRYHGKNLANIFASSKVVVAPDGPVTDNYWSNRVYLTMSLGGFIIHPYSAGLAKEYVDGKQIVFYHSRQECIELIDYYIEHEKEREDLRMAGYLKTVGSYRYYDRCKTMIDVVKKRLNINE